MSSERRQSTVGSGALRRALRIYLPGLVIAIAVCIPKLWQGGWSASDTTWYAAIADSAFFRAFSGDVGALWTLPGVDDQLYFNKPPMAFWLNGVPIAIFGPTILTARLGSVVALIALTLISVRLADLFTRISAGECESLHDTVALDISPAPAMSATAKGHRPAPRGWTRGELLSASAGTCTALWIELARHARAFSLDLWLSVFLLLALVGLLEVVRSRRPSWLVLTGVSIGCALLTKPLIPLGLFAIAPVWLLIYRERLRGVAGVSGWGLWSLAAIAAALAIPLPWHASMILQHGEMFTSQYFGREIAARAAGLGAEMNESTASLWFYPIHLLQSGWPFLLTTVLAIIALCRSATPAPLRRALLCCTIFLVVHLAAHSLFADKRPRYLLAIYPIAACMSAIWLAMLSPRAVRDFWAAFARWSPRLAGAAALILSLIPFTMHPDDSGQWRALAGKLRQLHSARFFSGALSSQRAACVYFHARAWPIAAIDWNYEIVKPPMPGDYTIYHAKDALAPGASEEIVWREQDLVLTRLLSEPWNPVKNPAFWGLPPVARPPD